ncbi:MAG: FmdB family zinc ribbon protein [Acidimicrobiales bacterium]
MPTYEYRCRDCGEELEVVQAFTDDALTECPACAGALRKVFGNIGIRFKGSGFYKNDARAAGTAKRDSSGDSSSDSSGGDSSKGDSSKNDSSGGDSSAGDSSKSGSSSEPAKSESSKTDSSKDSGSAKGEGGSSKTPRPKEGSQAKSA